MYMFFISTLLCDSVYMFNVHVRTYSCIRICVCVFVIVLFVCMGVLLYGMLSLCVQMIYKR